MPGDLQMLWRAEDPKQYHVEYAYSCMGYEIAGALGIKMAAPEREVYALVGDGSYLMMAQEIVTAVSENIKLIIVIVQNHGFSSIGALSESLGSQRFGTYYRYRNDETGLLDGATLPIDLAANAESLGADVIRVKTHRRVPRRAGCGPAPRPHHRRAHRHRPAGPGARPPSRWWDVPVSEVAAAGQHPPGPQDLRGAQGRAAAPVHRPPRRSRLMTRPVPAAAGDGARLLGRLVPRGPAPGGLAAVPRRGGEGRLPLHRARPAGLPAPGPGPAARRAGQPRPDGQRRHRVRRPAQGQGGPGQGDRGLRPGGAAAGRGRREVPGAPARAVHRHALRRGHRGRRPGRRAVAEPGLRHQRAGPGDQGGVRGGAGVPPARGHPRGHPGADRAVPVRHRPAVREPVPGHRAHLLLPRRQRADHRAVPGTDHLRAPQAGRPGGPGPGGGGEHAAVRGGEARRDGRAALRRAAPCRRCWTRWPSWTGTCTA